MKKYILLTLILLFSLFGALLFYRDGIILNRLGIYIENPLTRTVDVPDNYSRVDNNKNGIPDPMDIVNAAREEVEQHTTYKSQYYAGGFPPEDEGVCTDVIWRGLLGADVHLKELIDEDIEKNHELYPRVNGTPDPNIDFRRVPNQDVFFKRHSLSLTTELIPGEIENLKQWQPGDIVVFLDGFHHVGIISERRAKDGTPYIIHNTPPFASEIKLKSIDTPIAGHYRWKY